MAAEKADRNGESDRTVRTNLCAMLSGEGDVLLVRFFRAMWLGGLKVR